jgi:Na+/melibiose symporter-like transporter
MHRFATVLHTMEATDTNTDNNSINNTNNIMEAEIPASTSRDGIGMGMGARHTAASAILSPTGVDPNPKNRFRPPERATSLSFDSHSHHHPDDFGNKQHVMMGLTIAGVASSMLATIFGLFHVDVFLRAYELPLPTYSLGSFLFSIISTANNVAGAWLVDHVALTMPRSDLVGTSGCLFALLFLTPFFRWPKSNIVSRQSPFWDGLHFVTTMSLYDTLNSFTTILLGSVVTDNHSMSDQARVQFMASGKVLNLVASFAVARMGLAIFARAHSHNSDTDDTTDSYDLTQFRIFLVLLSCSAGMLFIVGQAMINGSGSGGNSSSTLAILRTTTRNLWRRSDSNKSRLSASRRSQHRDSDYDTATSAAGTTATDTSTSTSANTNTGGTGKKRKLYWRRVLQDFWRHDNFRAWIGMEMLLEAQNTFCITFLKTFVDQLILRDEHEVEAGGGGGGFSRGTCDWLLSMIRPLTQIVAIATYIPIRRLGYPRVYSILFWVNIVLSLLLLTLANESSTVMIIAFLCIYPVLTGAVQSAGFHLAMSDMVMEMKRKHAMEGRHDEPSLAGLFMGANALVCKPMESILPILTATVLDQGDKSHDKRNLFYLLILPPLMCSCLQLLAWRRFDLTPKRTVKMRDELKKLERGADMDPLLV